MSASITPRPGYGQISLSWRRGVALGGRCGFAGLALGTFFAFVSCHGSSTSAAEVEHGDDRHVGITERGDTLRHRELGQADDVVSGCMSVMSITNSLGMLFGVQLTSMRVDGCIDQTAVGSDGLGLAVEVHVDVDGDLLVHVDLEEIDVVDGAPDGVTLHLLHHGRVAGATDLQGEHGVGAGGAAEGQAQLAALDRDADGLHAVAVQDAGDVPLCPESSSGG